MNNWFQYKMKKCKFRLSNYLEQTASNIEDLVRFLINGILYNIVN